MVRAATLSAPKEASAVEGGGGVGGGYRGGSWGGGVGGGGGGGGGGNGDGGGGHGTGDGGGGGGGDIGGGDGGGGDGGGIGGGGAPGGLGMHRGMFGHTHTSHSEHARVRATHRPHSGCCSHCSRKVIPPHARQTSSMHPGLHLGGDGGGGEGEGGGGDGDGGGGAGGGGDGGGGKGNGDGGGGSDGDDGGKNGGGGGGDGDGGDGGGGDGGGLEGGGEGGGGGDGGVGGVKGDALQKRQSMQLTTWHVSCSHHDAQFLGPPPVHRVHPLQKSSCVHMASKSPSRHQSSQRGGGGGGGEAPGGGAGPCGASSSTMLCEGPWKPMVKYGSRAIDVMEFLARAHATGHRSPADENGRTSLASYPNDGWGSSSCGGGTQSTRLLSRPRATASTRTALGSCYCSAPSPSCATLTASRLSLRAYQWCACAGGLSASTCAGCARGTNSSRRSAAHRRSARTCAVSSRRLPTAPIGTSACSRRRRNRQYTVATTMTF